MNRHWDRNRHIASLISQIKDEILESSGSSLSTHAICKLAGLPPSNIYKWLYHEARPKLDTYNLSVKELTQVLELERSINTSNKRKLPEQPQRSSEIQAQANLATKLYPVKETTPMPDQHSSSVPELVVIAGAAGIIGGLVASAINYLI